jgi:hypothetical protein
MFSSASLKKKNRVVIAVGAGNFRCPVSRSGKKRMEIVHDF